MMLKVDVTVFDKKNSEGMYRVTFDLDSENAVYVIHSVLGKAIEEGFGLRTSTPWIMCMVNPKKYRSLTELLYFLEGLTTTQRETVYTLVNKYLFKHNGDVRTTLEQVFNESDRMDLYEQLAPLYTFNNDTVVKAMMALKMEMI